MEEKDGKVTAKALADAGADVTDDVTTSKTADLYGGRAVGGSPLVKDFEFYLSKPVKRVMHQDVNDTDGSLIHSVCIIDATDATLQTKFVVPNSVFFGRCRDTDGNLHSSDELAENKEQLAYKTIRGTKLEDTAKKLIARNAIQKYRVTGMEEYECRPRTGANYYKTLYAIELAD